MGKNEIKGTFEYDVNANLFKADLSLKIERTALKNDTLIYRLNTKANISELKGNQIISHDFSKLCRIGNSRANFLIIIVDTTAISTHFEFSLKYTIPEYTNYIHREHWFEIHSEKSTFPYMYGMKHDWALKLKMPKDFTIVSDAELVQITDTDYNYKLPNSTAGPAIFGGDRIIKKQYPDSKYPNLKIYSYFDEYGMMDSINHYIVKVLDFYDKTFAANKKRSDFTFMIVPYIHNYSFQRENFAMYRYFHQGDRFMKNKLSNLSTVFHEIGHLWWHNAPGNTYDNWLNESFAEYFSMLANRDVFGEEIYNKEIKHIRNNANNYGPIIEFKSPYTTILYRKGAYIVHELHQKLGYDKFINFSKNLIDLEIASVDACIDLLNKKYDPEIADWLYKRLRE